MDFDDVDKLRKLQAQRLQEARILRGFKSGSAAAKRFHWVVVTYNKHEAGERGVGRAYRKYARAFRVSPAWLLGHIDERDSDVAGVPMMSEAAVGVWHETNVVPVGTRGAKKISIPARDDEMDDRFSVPVADASVNKSFPRGAYVICASLKGRPANRISDFVVGDVLYIERLRGELKEISLRRVSAIDDKTLTLSTHSSDAKVRQPDLTFPSSRPDEKIRLVGRVVGKYEDYSPS
jgi:hypothetical protein